MPETATIQTNTNQAVVSVTEVDEAQIIEVSVSSTPVIVETGVVGPQGPMGPPGSGGSGGSTKLVDMEDVDAINRVDKSIVVYNAGVNKFTVNAIHTLETVTDGGNF